MPKAIEIPVSFGEVADKITILEIKSERIGEPFKLDNVRRELQALRAVWSRRFPNLPEDADALVARLKATNVALWDIEDAIRAQERDASFGPEFVRLARAVYRKNDERASLKRRIDELLDSPFREEKSYTSPG